MEKSVGEKLKECRKQRQWTQEELAKQLNITRQAVSNWERDKTLPDVYLLKEIAAVFDMTLDQYMENTKQAEVKMPKTPGRLFLASVAAIILYLVVGGLTDHLMVELVAGMIIIAVFCQGFIHLYMSSSVKTGNFSMLAGFDSKVEYRVEEVKKVLIQMDTHISCFSFGSILLLAFCAFMDKDQGEMVSSFVLVSYCLDMTLAICFYNFRSIDKTMVKEQDQKMAKAGYISLTWFLGWIFVFIGATFAKVEWKSIQNNSSESIGYLGWMFLFLMVTMAELFFEQYRVKKQIKADKTYRPGKAFWLSTVVTAVLVICMLFF